MRVLAGASPAGSCAFSRELPEFRRLIRPPDQPLQLLLQRLDEQSGRSRAHFDLAASDQQAEVERHRALGRRGRRWATGWTVMTPPAGPAYCITGRSPGMRVLDWPRLASVAA